MLFHYIVLVLPLIVCGVLATECVLSLVARYYRPHVMLLVWLLSCMMLYWGHFYYFHLPLQANPIAEVIYTTNNLLVYPLFLIYISELTDQKPYSRRPWVIAILTTPALLALVSLSSLYALMSDEEVRQYTLIGLYHQPGVLHGLGTVMNWVHIVCKVVFAIEVIASIVLGIAKIRRFNIAVDNLYADTEEKSLHKFKILFLLLVVFSFSSFGVNLLGRHVFLDPVILGIPSILFSGLLLVMGWYGLRQQFSIVDMELEKNGMLEEYEVGDTTAKPDEAQHEEESGERSGIPEKIENPDDENVFEKDKTLASQFSSIMVDERLFLRYDLKLDDVVQMMGTNRTYLLQAIRTSLGMSFSEYVNRLRISFAQQLERENPSMSREDIATRSGFNSLSSFYRNLKKYGSDVSD